MIKEIPFKINNNDKKNIWSEKKGDSLRIIQKTKSLLYLKMVYAQTRICPRKLDT